MLSLVPQAATLTDRYDDGENALHLTFQLMAPASWQAQPGQFLMHSLPGMGEAAFTFASLPDDEGKFTALVRMVGDLTRALENFPIGSIVGVRGPLGQPWPELAGKTVLVVAGGCGLAPLAAWLHQRINSNQQHKTALLYSARSEASQVLSRERESWLQTGLPLLQPVDQPAQEIAQA